MEKHTVLISGGSRGIGREIALQAVAHGYKTLITYRENAQEAEKTIKLAHAVDRDAHIHAYQLNVADSAAVETRITDLIDEHTQVHALINNGGSLRNNMAALMSDEEWKEVIATNLSGAFYMIRALLMHFISHRFGRIVNILSLAASGGSGQINYAASKAGLCGVTHTIAREYGAKNITTNGIVPGLVETDMVRDHLSGELEGKWQQYSPIKRLITSKEVADAALFLISEQAGAINGEILHVTGGLNYVP